jgi:predicted dehydrogenase
VAICGRNAARAEELAAKFEIPRAYSDYRAMLDAGGLDAVIIAVPDEMHYPIAMAALDAGLHVLAEKPMAMDVAQAQAMLAKAKAAKVKHMVCFTWRWWPPIRLMKHLLDEGQVGRPYFAQFAYVDGYARTPGYQWKWDRAHGLGVLGDLGSHMIDLARLTLGEISAVSAHIANHVARPHPSGDPYEPAGDTALLTLQFKSGAQASINISAVASAEERRMVIAGQAGGLDVNFGWGSPFVLRSIRDGEGAMQTQAVPEQYVQGIDSEADPYQRFLQVMARRDAGSHLFIESIIADVPIVPSFYDGVRVQAVIDAAFESNSRSCWVEVK